MTDNTTTRPRTNAWISFEFKDGSKKTGTVSRYDNPNGGFFIDYRDWWYEKQSICSTDVKIIQVGP
jgi:hypothetical protein